MWWNLTPDDQLFMTERDKQRIGPTELLVLIPCIRWMRRRGEKKEPGLPNEISWEDEIMRQCVR